MKAYKSLIRMNKAALDEKRRKLLNLEALMASLQADIRKLDEEVAQEMAFATDNYEVRFVLRDYLERAKERRTRLEEAVAQTERQIGFARVEVQGAYQDVRKYELAEENRLKKILQRRDKFEELELNEIGLNVYRLNRKANAEAAQ